MAHHLLVRGRDVAVPDTGHDHNYSQTVSKILAGAGVAPPGAGETCADAAPLPRLAAPRRYLFMRSHEAQASRCTATAQAAFQDPNLYVDVEALDDDFDATPTVQCLDDAEEDNLRELHRAGVPEVTDPVDWTVTIESASWYRMEHLRGLFQRLVASLNRDKLARLATAPSARALQLRQLAKELRLALGSVQWDRDWCRWVNYFLLTYLPLDLLASYVAGMRLVRRRLPDTFGAVFLEDKDLGRNVLRLNVVHVFSALGMDPAPDLAGAAAVSRFLAEVAAAQDVGAAAPRPVLLLIAPQCARGSERLRRLVLLLGGLGDVELLTANAGDCHTQSVARHFREQWEAVRRCVFMHPTRPVLALGLGPVACLAVILATATLKPADTAHLVGLVLLGAPSAEGQGFLAEVRQRTLLVVGADATHAALEPLDAARDAWSAPSQLLVVGGADHYLRLKPHHQRLHRVSQAQLDVALARVVQRFLGEALPDAGGGTGAATVDTGAAADELDVAEARRALLLAGGGGALQRRQRDSSVSSSQSGATAVSLPAPSSFGATDGQLPRRHPSQPGAGHRVVSPDSQEPPRPLKKRKQQHVARPTSHRKCPPAAAGGMRSYPPAVPSQLAHVHQQHPASTAAFRREAAPGAAFASGARQPLRLFGSRTQLPDAAETQAALAALCDGVADGAAGSRASPSLASPRAPGGGPLLTWRAGLPAEQVAVPVAGARLQQQPAAPYTGKFTR